MIRLSEDMIFGIVEGRRLYLRLEAGTAVEVPSEEQEEVRPPSFAETIRGQGRRATAGKTGDPGA